MELSLNVDMPTIMHIDLNSCFATIEQQAFPTLRGKPIVVAAYPTPGGCILAPSIEAKRLGIKTGMRIRDAWLLSRDIIVRRPNPGMVRYVHDQLRTILGIYSVSVVPKSIDEFIIDFTPRALSIDQLTKVGYEIKRRLREEIGEWMKCNIGIATNRFLAKLAASLHKPDGLDVIDHTNILDIYKQISLLDLHGINTRFQARLNAAGIFTPWEFYNASASLLHKFVFKSIIGMYWYKRLRGYEVDDVEFARKSIGQQYALKIATNDAKELSRFLMKLCEKMGRRLRRAGLSASGIHIWCSYKDGSYWQKGKLFHTQCTTTRDLYTKAHFILNSQPEKKLVSQLSVSCYGLTTREGGAQLSLFDHDESKEEKVSRALDKINDRYGEFTVIPATMIGMGEVILDRIAFGSVRD